MRAPSGKLTGTIIAWLLTQGQWLSAQTLEDLEAQLQVSRGLDQAAQPVLSLFTVALLAAALLVIGGIVLALGSVERQRERTVSGDWEGEGDSYSLNIAFLATGYAAIIIMLAYVPPALGGGAGDATRWILIAAAVLISIAHLLAARDEQALPPYLKYLFSGIVVLAAVFFHLAFKQWSFLHFTDPFYSGRVPFIALAVILLLVLVYSAHITWQHYRRVA
jgi:hypothetical protein